MRALFFLLLLCGCQAAFPIKEDPDATDPIDSHAGSDGSMKDAGGDDVIVLSDNYIPPPPPEAGIWCGAFGDAGTYCQGTCCVKIGNGYQFACKPKGDPCTGYNAAFSCDRLSDCPQNQYCCYTEMGAVDAGTYFAESHCGTCNQMDSMCLTGNDDCPDQTNCHPWFSAYGQCY